MMRNELEASFYGTRTGSVALHVGVEEDIIVNIVMEKEEAVITPQLAEALHKALNIPAHFWMKRQRHYDESLVNQQVAT